MSTRLYRPGPNNFDALRMAMALAVVWSHAFALYFGDESREPVYQLLAGCTGAGRVGVYVFFAISGFLISQSFERSRSAWKFLKKRLARIYPAYLVATSLCAFVVLPMYVPAHYSLATIAQTVALHLQLRDGFIAMPFVHNPWHQLNGSLWTIPYEFGCYLGVLVFGVAGLLQPRYRALAPVLLGISLVFHVIYDLGGALPSDSRLAPTVVPCFLAGVCAYQYRDRLPRNWAAARIGILLLILVSHFPGRASDVGFDLVMPPAIAYATFMLAFADRTVQAARYGDFSYGTYLYAWPIQQIMKASFGWMPFPVYVASSMVLSILAGVLSWHLIERWYRTSPSAAPQVQRATRTLESPVTSG